MTGAPLWKRIVYGTGDWSMSSFNTFRQIFYAVFLTDVVGLDPRYASVAALVGASWDAINDPLVGLVSDRLRTRWGRRRPLMVAFAIPFGLAFVGLWWAPPWESQLALAVHVALAYMISDTFQSLVVVPFLSLTPEIATGYDDVTRLTTWRMLFNLGASLAVAVIAPALVDAAVVAGSTEQQGYLLAGALFGAIGVLPPLLIAAVVRERAPPADEPSMMETVRGALANRPFRFLVVLYLINWITFDLIGLMIPYLVRWYLAGDGATMAVGPVTLPVESAMLGALIVVSIASLPLWTWVATRLEKRTAYILAMSLWLAILLVVWFVPPGALWLAVAVTGACGVGVSAAHVIPDAMVPDVLDEDELNTGRRNEGIYYGARNLIRKAGGALAVFFALQILGWSGYVASTGGEVSQPESAVWAVRMLAGPAGAVLLAAAMAAAWWYPVTRAHHDRVEALLSARRSTTA